MGETGRNTLYGLTPTAARALGRRLIRAANVAAAEDKRMNKAQKKHDARTA